MTPIRWRALCEPATLPVSSFTQSSPLPRARAAPPARAAARTASRANPGRRRAAIGASSSRDQVDERRRRSCRRSRQRVRRAAASAVADERVGVALVRERRAMAASEPPDERGRRRRRSRAVRAAERRTRPLGGRQRRCRSRRTCGSVSMRRPARALNSSIISSQAGRIRVQPRQNEPVAARRELGDGHALLLDPGVVAEVEDARPVDAPTARAGGRSPAPSRCCAEGLAGADLVEAAAEVAAPAPSSRSLPYIAAPSVATVRTSVVRAEVEVLRRLDRRETLQMLERPSAASAATSAGGHAAPLDQVVAAGRAC